MSNRSDKQAAIEALERIFENYQSKDLSNSALPVLTDYDVWADYFLIREYLDPSTYSNADRIRVMTDEEIAELLTDDAVFDSRYIIVCPSKPEGDCAATDCRECLLRWLKQDYKGGKEDGMDKS